MTRAPQAYGDAAFRDKDDWEDEDDAQPAFPARPRALSPERGSSLMWLLAGCCSAGAFVLAVSVLLGALS